jgi:hypothetical protein
MDGGGVLYDTKDPREVALLMEAVLDDPRLEEAVLESQDAALARLRAKDFGGTLLRYVADVARGPARPAPEVAWDFWHQFEQFDRFEEFRQFRPALYRALPAARSPLSTVRESDGETQSGKNTDKGGQISDAGTAHDGQRTADNGQRTADSG